MDSVVKLSKKNFFRIIGIIRKFGHWPCNKACDKSISKTITARSLRLSQLKDDE